MIFLFYTSFRNTSCILHHITLPHILRLETQLVDLWITRLSEEPDKEIRNDYCRQLNKLMKSGKLRYPFSKIPPAGRLPLYEDIVVSKANVYSIHISSNP